MDDVNDVTLYDVVKKAIECELDSRYFTLPAKVIKFNSSDMTVDVQLMISETYFDESYNLPPLESVPVIMPRGLAGGMSYELKKDDDVILQFIQRSSGNWRSSTEMLEPELPFTFDINDAIAIPNVHPINVSYKYRQGTMLAGEKLFVGNPDGTPYALTNAAGSGTEVQSDVLQILSAIIGCFDVSNVIATPTGPAQLQPNVYADLIALKNLIDAMILES